jgi:hypothetical protein
MLGVAYPYQAVPRKNVKDISVYVQPEVREGLKVWADSEQRTLSSLCAYLLTKAYEDYQRQQQGKQ